MVLFPLQIDSKSVGSAGQRPVSTRHNVALGFLVVSIVFMSIIYGTTDAHIEWMRKVAIL